MVFIHVKSAGKNKQKKHWKQNNVISFPKFFIKFSLKRNESIRLFIHYEFNRFYFLFEIGNTFRFGYAADKVFKHDRKKGFKRKFFRWKKVRIVNINQPAEV